jgi:hypothetical protein
MLTIQNQTKGADPDVGIVIGSFKLVNAGLYNRPDAVTGVFRVTMIITHSIGV